MLSARTSGACLIWSLLLALLVVGPVTANDVTTDTASFDRTGTNTNQTQGT